jgi:hypothetical protein
VEPEKVEPEKQKEKSQEERKYIYILEHLKWNNPLKEDYLSTDLSITAVGCPLLYKGLIFT